MSKKITKLYNNYHCKTQSFNKVVNLSNFTYIHILKTLDPFIQFIKFKKVLDYGSGSGTISLYLASKGAEIVGIDISNKVVAAANESAINIGLRNKARFFTVNQGFNYIKNKKFDIILCLEVIEHVKNDYEILDILNKHLNKKGVLVLSTPSDKAPLYKMKLTKKFDRKVGHLRRYNLQNLGALLNKTGFKIQSVEEVEGVIRNSLYVFPSLGFLIRFIRGPIAHVVTFIDNISGYILGKSDFIIIAKKK